MKTTPVRRLVPLLAGALVCLPAFAAEPAPLLDEARKIAGDLSAQLGGELRRELELSGALRSVIVCKYLAPEVTSALSREVGAQVRRVTLRVRNPALGTPDPWEQRVLADFERRVEAGDRAEGMEFFEVVSEPQGEFFRYMKAIPTSEACLACHGVPEAMSPATRAQFAADYPHDRATGYRVGSVRGAVSYKKKAR